MRALGDIGALAALLAREGCDERPVAVPDRTGASCTGPAARSSPLAGPGPHRVRPPAVERAGLA